MIVTFYFNFSNGFQLVLKISCLENSVELDRLSLFLKCKIETTSPRDIAIGQEDLSGYPAGQLRFFYFALSLILIVVASNFNLLHNIFLNSHKSVIS